MPPAVRSPAVAGTFYASDPDRLAKEVRAHLAAAEPVTIDFTLRILIVPHAGLVYSGPIAATGYQLVEVRDDLRRIVMLGPAHYVAFSGLALPGVDMLATPLGNVTVDPTGIGELLNGSLVADSAVAHRQEHSLEVQLPFLQIVAAGLPVIPLLTGQANPAEVADVVEPLLDERTLLLVSSDLSHYQAAETARRLDGLAAAAIERLDPAALGRESACGRTGIQVALLIARRRGYTVRVLDLRNSADTAGSPERVVGYGTFAMGD